MTTPDPYAQDPIDLSKPGASGTAGYPAGPGYPQTSGYPPLPDSLYPPAPVASLSDSYPSAPGYPPGYGQPGYGQPGYGQPYAYGNGYPAPRNGMGTTALVLGIIAVVLSWTFWVGVVLGILAICFGGVGLGRVGRGEATNRGAALAGLILGIVALALLVILVIVGIGLIAGGMSVSG